MVRASTKKKRIDGIMKVLAAHSHKQLSIVEWLSQVNSVLSDKISYRSARELSKAFRYLRVVKEVPLIRLRGVSCEGEYRHHSTFYSYEPEMVVEVAK